MQHILVVEDDAMIARAVRARLTAEGFQVSVVAAGDSAIEQFPRLAPDLVILDLMLPGVDGLEVCRRLQSQRPVPVIMLTAKTDEVDMLVGLRLGADDYLTKPFSPRELVARVQALLRRVQRERGAAQQAADPPLSQAVLRCQPVNLPANVPGDAPLGDGVAMMLILAAPDAVIARHNIGHAQSGVRPLDVDYVVSLSDDAVPPPRRCVVAGAPQRD